MRDEVLTMSDEQALSIPADGNLSATDSTNEVPEPASGYPEPSGATPARGLIWKTIFVEATGTPIQVEGELLAELQYSLDGGSTWETVDGTEIQLDDPALVASGIARRAVNVGRAFKQDLSVTDPANVRWKTVYSTTSRTAGDGAATVNVTSHLTTVGGFTGD